jgi:hypothetical protein
VPTFMVGPTLGDCSADVYHRPARPRSLPTIKVGTTRDGGIVGNQR